MEIKKRKTSLPVTAKEPASNGSIGIKTSAAVPPSVSANLKALKVKDYSADTGANGLKMPTATTGAIGKNIPTANMEMEEEDQAHENREKYLERLKKRVK